MSFFFTLYPIATLFYLFSVLCDANWGPSVESIQCPGQANQERYPCMLRDGLKLSFLYQVDANHPSFYQENTFLKDTNDFFYQKITEHDYEGNLDKFDEMILLIGGSGAIGLGETLIFDDPPMFSLGFSSEFPLFDEAAPGKAEAPKAPKTEPKTVSKSSGMFADTSLFGGGGADMFGDLFGDGFAAAGDQMLNTITKQDIIDGKVYRKINRKDLTYVVVKALFDKNDLDHELNILRWDSFEHKAKDIKDAHTFFVRFDEIPTDDYTETNYNTIIQAHHADAAEQAALIQWIQTDSYGEMDMKSKVTKKSIQEIDVFIPKHDAELVDQHRVLSKELYDNRHVEPVVRKVLKSIWKYINAIEGIALDGVTGCDGCSTVADAPAPKKQNVIRYFTKFTERQVRNGNEKVIPGTVAFGTDESVSDDYTKLQNVVESGNRRTMMIMINSYGYGSCRQLFDVIYAFVDEDKPKIEFYKQFGFNEEDINRRIAFLNQFWGSEYIKKDDHRLRLPKPLYSAIPPTDSPEEIKKKKRQLFSLCKTVRWQKSDISDICEKKSEPTHTVVSEGLAVLVDRLPRKKDIDPPLTDDEKAFIVKQARETANFKNEKIYPDSYVFDETFREADMIIPWYTAYSLVLPDYRVPCVYEALKMGRLYLAGASKSSDLLMDIAASFLGYGEASRNDLFWFECAIISGFAAGPSHSVNEVLLGFPYHEIGIHDEYKIEMDPFKFIRDLVTKHGADPATVGDNNYYVFDSDNMLYEKAVEEEEEAQLRLEKAQLKFDLVKRKIYRDKHNKHVHARRNGERLRQRRRVRRHAYSYN